jgi:hypothetical protein
MKEGQALVSNAIRWMMNKSNIMSQTLINDASAYYVNLKNTGAWKV